MAASVRAWLGLLALALGLGVSGARAADDLPEYRLKAAFLYNFALFTEWPADVGNTLRLCVFGDRSLRQRARRSAGQGGRRAQHCVAAQDRHRWAEGLPDRLHRPRRPSGQLPRVLEALEGQTVLTVADSPGAARQGVALNMAVVQNKVSFEANLRAARAAKVNLSSKLLRLATEVIQ